MSPATTDWATLTGGADKAAAVRAHLASFLTRTEEDGALLDQVMSRFESARVTTNRLELQFQAVYGDSLTVEADAPYDGPTEGIAPTVLDVVRVHNGFGWDDYGGGATAFYGYDKSGEPCYGGFDWEYLEECEEDCGFLAAVAAAGLTIGDVQAPFDAGQDWVLWHPTERNAHGEPMQYYFSHEGGDPERRDETYELTLGQVLLRDLFSEVCEA